jgi:hypothetical protein
VLGQLTAALSTGCWRVSATITLSRGPRSVPSAAPQRATAATGWKRGVLTVLGPSAAASAILAILGRRRDRRRRIALIDGLLASAPCQWRLRGTACELSLSRAPFHRTC